MRTNIDIDDELLAAAQAATGLDHEEGDCAARPRAAGAARSAAGDPRVAWRSPVGRRLGDDARCLVIVVDSSVWIDYFNGVTTP